MEEMGKPYSLIRIVIGRPQFVFHYILGLFVGYFMTNHLYGTMCFTNVRKQLNIIHPSKSSQWQNVSVFRDHPKTLFVGVMTAEKFLNSRVLAAHKTWAKTIPGHMAFFSSENSKLEAHPEIPVVALPGTDDSYPPQKKSLLMLKYMHDHFADDYDWFMRADDDIYVRGDRLALFLNSIDSNRFQFIGQAGIGTKEELGQLFLDNGENFCMGGPGMIFSRSTLKAIMPHIDDCLKNLLTFHEDVEVGRCVRLYAHVPCTWSFEMQRLFYHNHDEPHGSFTGPLSKSLLQSITLHPLKSPEYLYRMHSFLLSSHTTELRHRILLKQRWLYLKDIYSKSNRTSEPSLTKFRPHKTSHIVKWNFIKSHYYSSSEGNPRLNFNQMQKAFLSDVINSFITDMNSRARQRGRRVEFKQLLYGYIRVDPQDGVDIISDLLLIYRKHRGRRMSVHVRRHSYLQIPFANLEFRTLGKPLPQPIIHMIVPLKDRSHKLKTFLNNLVEKCFSKTSPVLKIAFVLFNGIEAKDNEEIIRSYQDKSTRNQLFIIYQSGDFSRGRALQAGSNFFSASTSLQLFIDVDIHLSEAALHRVVSLTVLGKQVYFPIVFSQYEKRLSDNDDNLSERNGFWRLFGFGIASMYKLDFNKIGGFDSSIVGWGKEDVDLYERFVKSNISVIRAIDKDMMHKFHSIKCDKNLFKAQYEMCEGTAFQMYASTNILSKMVYNNTDIFNRGENISNRSDFKNDNNKINNGNTNILNNVIPIPNGVR